MYSNASTIRQDTKNFRWNLLAMEPSLINLRNVVAQCSIYKVFKEYRKNKCEMQGSVFVQMTADNSWCPSNKLVQQGLDDVPSGLFVSLSLSSSSVAKTYLHPQHRAPQFAAALVVAVTAVVVIIVVVIVFGILAVVVFFIVVVF
jgi:hypothetical protein